MSGPNPKLAGQSLFEAEKHRSQIGMFTEEFPDMTLADAYAVQDAFVAQKKAAGAKVIGWKIGLTSRAMQDALKIETPDSGVLFDDMLFQNAGVVPTDRFIQPRVEAEIAFVLKTPLNGAVSREDVIAATDHIVPALEILDTRIQRVSPTSGAIRKVQDTIADNAANAGLVLGDPHPVQDDMRWLGAIVKRNGVVEETGLGAGVLGDPALGIVWLAKRLAEFGAGLEAGQVVLSGSFIRPLECPHGARIDADFAEFGQVSISFA